MFHLGHLLWALRRNTRAHGLFNLPCFLHEFSKDLILQLRFVEELEVLEVFNGIFATWRVGLFWRQPIGVPYLIQVFAGAKLIGLELGGGASGFGRNAKKSLPITDLLFGERYVATYTTFYTLICRKVILQVFFDRWTHRCFVFPPCQFLSSVVKFRLPLDRQDKRSCRFHYDTARLLVPQQR